MSGTDVLGKILIGKGILLVVFGLIVLAAGKLGGLWKPLPGDIVVRRHGLTLMCPPNDFPQAFAVS